MKKKDIILLPRGAADKMCADLKIGKTTLYAALNFTSWSESAKNTRDLAVNKYGGYQTRKPIL